MVSESHRESHRRPQLSGAKGGEACRRHLRGTTYRRAQDASVCLICQHLAVTADELSLVLDGALRILRDSVEQDWSRVAGTLEWTCWQTVDHTIDCVFSYSMQVAARAQSGYLPFNELHAMPEASARDLVEGLGAVGRMLIGVVRGAPADTSASDGVVVLELSDWCARAAYEIGLHTHDVTTGLGIQWRLPGDLCRSIVASPVLWMLDRTAAAAEPDPWKGLLIGSGRTAN